MKNSELYFKTVDILVNAYFNDTLQHGNCAACAVGNIIAANNGIKIKKCINGGYYKGERDLVWDFDIEFMELPVRMFGGGFVEPIDVCNMENEKIKNIIDNTPYSLQELAKMEQAFESRSIKNMEGDWMFNGLMAVIDVLDIIHENTDANVTSSTKQKFTHA